MCAGSAFDTVIVTVKSCTSAFDPSIPYPGPNAYTRLTVAIHNVKVKADTQRFRRSDNELPGRRYRGAWC